VNFEHTAILKNIQSSLTNFKHTAWKIWVETLQLFFIKF